MKISKNWLLDILNVEDINIDLFIKKMIMAGFNVEKHYNFSNIEKIYAGKIINITEHPNNNKLFLYNIITEKNAYQLISKYNQLNIGDIIPIALENSIINNNIIVNKIIINDIISEGIICNMNDLGLTNFDEPNLYHQNNVMIFNENTNIGSDIKKNLDMDDIIFDIEITNNRNDCCTAYGLAAEIASIFKFKLKSNNEFIIKEKIFENKIVKKEKCINKYIHSFFFQTIEINKISSSPRWLRRRLASVGIESKNKFLIDIINYINYYYGYKIYLLKINAKEKITIDFQNNEIIFLNNKQKKIIPFLDINNKNILSDDNDIFILLNVNIKDTFLKNNINYLKNHLLIKTLHNSFYNRNYENFISLFNLLISNDKNLKTIDEFYYKQKNNEMKKIIFNVDKINQILGYKLDLNIMVEILETLYFKYDIKNNYLYVPKYRSDINNINDISEEIARMYGYDKILKNENQYQINKYDFRKKYNFKYDISKVCRFLGFNEIITLPFLNYKYTDILNLEIKNSEIVYIKNPINDENNCMRYALIPSLFDVFNNSIIQNKNILISMYEIGKIYLYINDCYKELERLCLISNDVENFLNFKEKIATILKDIINVNFKQSKNISWLHTYQQSTIYSNDLEIGYIGKIHPEILLKLNLKNIYIAEIYFDKLFSIKNINKNYIKISKFPSIVRDLSLICDKNIPALDIEKMILSVDKNKLINKIILFDVYKNESKIGLNKICLTFSITFTDINKTLIDETVINIITDILSLLYNKYKIKLRDF